MKISVILPILNEDGIISKTITDLTDKLSKYTSDFEILAVNDGSIDNSAHILNKIKLRNNKLKIINHPTNRGYGAALQTGVKQASYDWILFMDSDMQFDPKEIDRFIPFHNNYDFIIGYRVKRADSKQRIVISKIYNTIIRLLFSLEVTDVDCAFKLMRKSSIQKLGELPNSFFVSTALLAKAIRSEVRIKELPVKHLPRTKGLSTVTPVQVLRTLKDLAIIYTQLNPNRFYTDLYPPINKILTNKKYD